MPRPSSYAVFCLKKKRRPAHHAVADLGVEPKGGVLVVERVEVTTRENRPDHQHAGTRPTHHPPVNIDRRRAQRDLHSFPTRRSSDLTHAYSIVIGSKHITLNATGGGFLTASKQFRHGATSKSRSNTASNSTKHKSPHLSGWRQIISLIT